MAGMGSLYVGVSGLQASQNALNTTAHNLANVETEGYVRQQVLLGNLAYNKVGISAVGANQIGLGVTVEEIRQVRDYFLDKSYRLETGRQSFYETGYEVVSEVETLFGELEGVAFQTSLKELKEAIQELAKDPSSAVNRSLLKQKAVAFVERASGVATGLASYQTNLDLQVSDNIDKINELGQTINDLNEKILKIETGGTENANDLRDLRNNALDELASLIKIDYKEDGNGIITVRAEGVEFVTRNQVYSIDKTKDPATGFTNPVWSHLNNTPVYDLTREISSDYNTDIGELKSLILARGTEKSDYLDVPVEPKVSDYASETDPEYIKAIVQYEQDVKNYNASTEPSIIMNVMAEYDHLIHGIVTSINNILCPNVSITDDFGNTYSVLDMDSTSYSNDGNTVGTELFSRVGVERYTKKTLTVNGELGEYYVYNEEVKEDSSSLYSVWNIKVNEAVLKDTSLLPLTKADGSVDYARAAELEDAWSTNFATLNPNTKVWNDFEDYYTTLVGSIGTAGDVYSSLSKAGASTTSELINKRSSVIGVSSDEELTNMIKYQNAYNASSRYITVVSDMLEHIINTLGV